MSESDAMGRFAGCTLVSQCGLLCLSLQCLPRTKTSKCQEEACCSEWLFLAFRKLKRIVSIGSPTSQREYPR